MRIPDYNFLSPVKQGVPQGDPPSGYVFGIVLARVNQDLRSRMAAQHCQWGDDFQVLAYADDLVILAGDAWAQQILDSLVLCLATVGSSLRRRRRPIYRPSMRRMMTQTAAFPLAVTLAFLESFLSRHTNDYCRRGRGWYWMI